MNTVQKFEHILFLENKTTAIYSFQIVRTDAGSPWLHPRLGEVLQATEGSSRPAEENRFR